MFYKLWSNVCILANLNLAREEQRKAITDHSSRAEFIHGLSDVLNDFGQAAQPNIVLIVQVKHYLVNYFLEQSI